MDQFESSFYLNRTELAIALSEQDITDFYCLNLFGDEITISDDEACRTLFEMVQEELVSLEEEAFDLSDTLKSAVACIKNASVIMVLYAGSIKRNNGVLYLAGQTTCLLEQVKNRKASVKVTCLKTSDLPVYFEEWLPPVKPLTDDEDELRAQAVRLNLDSQSMLSVTDDFTHILNDSNTLLLVEICDADKKRALKKLTLVQCRGQQLMGAWTEKGYDGGEYAKDKMIQEISAAMPEECYDNC